MLCVRVSFAGSCLLMLLLSGACGPPATPKHHPTLRDAVSDRTWMHVESHLRALAAWEALPAADRSARILAEVMRLSPATKIADPSLGLRPFVIAMLERGDFQALLSLNRELLADPSRTAGARRTALHKELSYRRDWQGTARLLRQLAVEEPRSVQLAPYRESGMVYLLEVAEDPHAPVGDRVEALLVLGRYADSDVVPRLEQLRGDVTAVLPVSGLIWPPSSGAPVRTIGDVAGSTIRTIRARTDD